MIRKILGFYTITAIFLAAILFFAANTSLAKQKGYDLPKDAVRISDNVYSLGTARDPKSGKIVEGYAIVHRKDADAKPGTSASAGKGAICYGFLAKGAKWKVAPEPWVVNPANNSSISDSFVLNSIETDIGTWETAAQANVLGNGSTTSTDLSAGANTLNGANEVYFDTITNSNTIAVTTVWGIFSGPTLNRELVEWDQVYNTFYNWSDSGEAGKMDFRNINTHELGHALGLADLYTASCGQQTMYGYASAGETNKQTLETGDKTGIQTLY